MTPFLKLPIVLPGNPQETEADKKVLARIQPGEVESFNDAYHWGALIKFRSGEIIMTELSADQFEAMLADYWKKYNEALKKMQQGNSIFLQ